MDRIDHKFKKKYGQNFLQDKALINKIANYISLDSDDLVIEIGPGAGAITKELVNKCHVLAYEIDLELKMVLDKIDTDKLNIIWDDFLNRNVLLDIQSYNYKKLYIIANLPYYITTPIITKIIDEKLPVENILVMVQKEVADRLTSLPGNKEYGSITVFLNYYFDIKKVFNVSRNLFYPKPNVDSSVISLKTKKEKLYVKNEDGFLNFIRECFKYKRKTLKNNLGKYNLLKAESILKKYNLDLTVRAEALSLEIFVDLYNNI